MLRMTFTETIFLKKINSRLPMDIIYLEKLILSYKRQKYQLLVNKQLLLDYPYQTDRITNLFKAIDILIIQVEAAIQSTTTILEHAKAIEAEQKNYALVNEQIQNIMFNNNLITASHNQNIRKLKSVGKIIKELDELLLLKN